MLVSHDKYQGYFVLAQKVYNFVLGYISQNEELETQVFFGKVPWDIKCNMDGICNYEGHVQKTIGGQTQGKPIYPTF